jgi:pimeloyl-ACP methyl ester carboxylesterase
VVLIHGLWSNPWSWARMIKEMEADATLRARYQFWTFGYSTGDPLAYSATMLRRDLDEVRRKFDPERSDAAFNRMVVVGHRIGGPAGQDDGPGERDPAVAARQRSPR